MSPRDQKRSKRRPAIREALAPAADRPRDVGAGGGSEEEPLEAFWRRLADASVAVLMLDYDGTLAPFRVERDEAVPYPGVRETLTRLVGSAQTRLVIVSGREIEEVRELLDLDPSPEIWGLHGFDRRLPDGERRTARLPGRARQNLSSARRLVSHVLPAQRIEAKTSAVAFHWRGLVEADAAEIERQLLQLLEPLTGASQLELNSFDGGLELRYAKPTKARAVREIVAEVGQEAAIAYLGDDRTDEDAFRALRGIGLPLLVRSEPRPTAAVARLTPPDELLEFLSRWMQVRKGKADA